MKRGRGTQSALEKGNALLQGVGAAGHKSLARTLGKEKNWFASSRVARVAKGPPQKNKNCKGQVSPLRKADETWLSCQCFVCMGGGAANNCVSYKGSVCMHGSAAILA